MPFSISTIIRSFGYLTCLGLLVIETISLLALTRPAVPGPADHRSIAGQTLAFAPAPPLSVVEAYLDANLAARDFAAVSVYGNELAALHRQYDDQRAVWSGAALAPPVQAALTQPDLYAQAFWQQVEGRLLPAIAAGHQAAASQALAQLAPTYQAQRAAVRNLAAKEAAATASNQALAARQRRLYIALSLGATMLMLCLVLFGLRVMTLLVLRPIADMATYMTELAAENLNAAIPCPERDDEIGRMAKAAASFRTTRLRLREADASLTTARRNVEEERQKNDEARAEAAKAQQFVVETALQNLHKPARS